MISYAGKLAYLYWASSTGLTAVRKFKPRLPAPWAVSTHRKGASRMDKVTSRMNWPIRNSTQIRNWIQPIDSTIMWSPSFLFISNRFYGTQNNFGPLNDHIITELFWVVTMAPPAKHWHLTVNCNVTVAIVKTIVIVAYLPYQITRS